MKDSDVLLIIVVVLSVVGSLLIRFFKVPFTIRDKLATLNDSNNNILTIQKEILAVQRDVLSCLQEISKSQNTDGEEHCPAKE